MDKYQETFETWNKIASVYEDKFMDLDLYNETYDSFLQSIKKGKAKILDIGCGPGNISKYLLSKRPEVELTGIDIAPNMVKLAKKNNPTANFKILDSRHISELEDTYDGIICGFCLPYLSEKEGSKLIQDCKGLLSEAGILYLSFVEGDPKKSEFKVGSNGNRVYFNYHNLDFLNGQLVENQFQELRTFDIDYPKAQKQPKKHTVVIAKKVPST